MSAATAHSGHASSPPRHYPQTRGPHFLLALNLGNLARRLLGLLNPHLCACGFGRLEKENDMDWNTISFAFVLPVFIFGAIGLGVYAQRLPG